MKDANRTVSSTTAVTPATLWFPPYGVRYVFSLSLGHCPSDNHTDREPGRQTRRPLCATAAGRLLCGHVTISFFLCCSSLATAAVWVVLRLYYHYYQISLIFFFLCLCLVYGVKMDCKLDTNYRSIFFYSLLCSVGSFSVLSLFGTGRLC